MKTTKPERRNPAPGTFVTGECHWERDAHEDYLVDEAGVVWQTFWRGGPQDTWADSIQRHKTMGDAR